MVETILTGIGIVIMTLLSIIAYFIKGIHTDFNLVKDDVSDMKLTINTLQANNKSHEKDHTVIDTRLNAHSERLNVHDKELVAIKTKINQPKKN